MSVTLKLADNCSNWDQTNLCAYYKSVTYLSFNNAPSLPPTTTTTGTLNFNSPLISATNTVHTLAANYAINSGAFLVLKYYSQVSIPAVCVLSSNNGQCYSYPLTNTIIIKTNITYASSFSFSLSGMTNPYQNTYGTNTFYT